MRRHVGHPAIGTRGADAAPLAAEGEESLLSAVLAPDPREPEGEDAAGEISPKFGLHPGCEPIEFTLVRHREEGLEMVLHDFLEAGGLGASASIDGAGRETCGELGDRRRSSGPGSVSGSTPAGRW